MAMIGKVLRMHHREKKSVREIATATGLSRNTVLKHLRTNKAEPARYRRPAVGTNLTPFVEAVKMASLADARRPRKERRTAKAVLKQIGQTRYEGGYTWAAAGFIDTLLRWKMKLEVGHGNEKAIQPGVQIRGCQAGQRTGRVGGAGCTRPGCA